MTRITHRLINFLVRFVILIGNLLEVLRRGGRNDMLYGCVKIKIGRASCRERV